MLMPKRTKYRKYQRNRNGLRGTAYRGSRVTFGDYAMKAVGRGEITNRQIEAARVAINRVLKHQGKIWIRVFPDFPLTKKPAETRMGKGKGAIEHWVAVVKPGRILYEVSGVSEELAKKAFKLAAQKFNVEMKFAKRSEWV
jgi:large subunit ribosomal protein L16